MHVKSDLPTISFKHKPALNVFSFKAGFSLSKNFQNTPVSGIIEETGV